MRCGSFALLSVLSSRQRGADDFWDQEDELPLDPAAEDVEQVVNDDQLGDMDQLMTITAGNVDDGVTDEHGDSRSRSAASSDGQPLQLPASIA